MSRIGRMPIEIPAGVQVNIKKNTVTVTGPKGELTRSFNRDMSIKLQENILTVSRPSDSKQHRSLHGLTRSLLANMVEGVTKSIERNLDIVGVGYRAEQAGDKLVIRIGYSHPVEVSPLPGELIRRRLARWQQKSGPSAPLMPIKARASGTPVNKFASNRVKPGKW